MDKLRFVSLLRQSTTSAGLNRSILLQSQVSPRNSSLYNHHIRSFSDSNQNSSIRGDFPPHKPLSTPFDEKSNPKLFQRPSAAQVNGYLNMQSFWKSAGTSKGGDSSPSMPVYNIGGHSESKKSNFETASKIFSVVASIAVISFIIFSVSQSSSGNFPPGLNGGHQTANIENITDRLSDLKGCDDVLDELNELIDFLKNPEKYQRLGASIPRGVLLSGPPGTGKTLAARAIAGEAGVNFFWASAADFDEMYVGVGSKRIRSLFKEARQNAPAVIFIDEIDAFANRKSSIGKNTRSTVNSLLVEMDGFNSNENIMVIAATNFVDDLDEALTRPGRFDRKLALSTPDLKGRMELFKHYITKVKHATDIDIKRLASSMMGATGADIKTIVNNAAIKAARDNLAAVTHHHIEESKENWAMGVANRSKEYSKESLERTAYHEGGHALVALLTPGGPDIYRATILPRGGALGYVSFTNDQETDNYSVTYKQYKARLDVAMGGRVAEELIYGAEEITSGASSDLQSATRTARQMVTKFGYSQKNGLMVSSRDMPVGSKQEDVVDEEVTRLLDESYKRAKQLLTTNKDKLELLARGMLKYETISATEIKDLISGKPINRDANIVLDD